MPIIGLVFMRYKKAKVLRESLFNCYTGRERERERKREREREREILCLNSFLMMKYCVESLVKKKF